MEEIEDDINQLTCKLSSWFSQLEIVMMQFLFKLIYAINLCHQGTVDGFFFEIITRRF